MLNGINDHGDVVGTYEKQGDYHSFIYSNGEYTSIDDPLATAGTRARGINNQGDVVGVYYTKYEENGTEYKLTHGFVYSGGEYTPLDPPGKLKGLDPFSINNNGDITGCYQDKFGQIHGFLESGVVFSKIPDPVNGHNIRAYGLNDNGSIVGWLASSDHFHGFIKT